MNRMAAGRTSWREGAHFLPRSSLNFNSAMPKVRANGLVGPDVCSSGQRRALGRSLLVREGCAGGARRQYEKKERLSRFLARCAAFELKLGNSR